MSSALPSPSYGDPNLPPHPCPVPDCAGRVFVRRLGGGLKTFGCDADEYHSESVIRPMLIAQSAEWEQENTAAMSVIERRLDPVAWIQDRVLEAQHEPETKFEREDLGDYEALPSYRTGIIGNEVGRLLSLHGMTTLSGIASSGKTWFALGSACQSALDGWDVHYLAAEAGDVIKRRVAHAFGESPPPLLSLHGVKPGVSVQDMIGEIAEWITTTRTLLVIDSVSTIMGLMALRRGADRWEEQGKLEMFLMQLRALTLGQVAIINISEANAQGEAKGRTLFHRSDVGISFKSLDESEAKEIRVQKAWEGRTGPLGRAMVNPEGPGLSLVPESPVASSAPEFGDF